MIANLAIVATHLLSWPSRQSRWRGMPCNSFRIAKGQWNLAQTVGFRDRFSRQPQDRKYQNYGHTRRHRRSTINQHEFNCRCHSRSKPPFERAMTRILAIFIIWLAISPCFGTQWYVSTNGSGNGSITNPWPIQLALTNSSVVEPGDTIWLRGGTYGVGTNVYMCRLIGTSNNPIIVRNYRGERAIIDGGILDAVPYKGNGSYTTFWGFEITCTTARTNEVAGRTYGFQLGGSGQKVINMTIHDTSEACIGFGTTSTNSFTEVYGCILWGCGIYDTNSADGSSCSSTNPWTRGSPIYAQNKYNTATVSDVISSRNFTTAMKAYSQNGWVNGFTFSGNIMWGSGNQGLEIDDENNSVNNATVVSNYVYRCQQTSMGHEPYDTWAPMYGLTFSNNYIVDNTGYAKSAVLWLNRWVTMQVIGNTIITPSLSNDWSAGSTIGNNQGSQFINLYPSTNIISNIINCNAYYGGVGVGANWNDWTKVNGTNVYGLDYHTFQPFQYNQSTNVLSWVQWTNGYGFDLNSTYSTNLPTTNVVVVRPNKYEVGRGHIVVFNWQSNSTVSVDISSLGLTNGQSFEVLDAQNYLGTPCIATNFNTAQPVISLPLTLTNITALTPAGDINPATYPMLNPNVHTSSFFNAFVVLPIYPATALTAPTVLRIVGPTQP